MTEKTEKSMIFLHGDLKVRIIEAKNLPNMDLFSERIRRCVSAVDWRKDSAVTSTAEPKEHRWSKHVISSDAYVKVCLAGACVGRTQVIHNSSDPKWGDEMNIPVAHNVSEVEFRVKDHDMFGADLIGSVKIPAARIASGEMIKKQWFDVINESSGKTPKKDTALKLNVSFTPCDKNGTYSKGVLGEHGLKQSYFPLRHEGKVTLYQDAHVTDHDDILNHKIELDENILYEHNRCWEDICHAILDARHLVYIMGWSIYHKVKLVREPSKERRLPASLGDLLKDKSRQGVRVLVLAWDDRTSQRKAYLKTKGVMDTHDEETKKFFKHSSVICMLAPRYANDKLSFIKQHVVGTIYSHHQKCVVVDSEGPGNNRKITAFLGGLDLTDGRYDTPEHRLFEHPEKNKLVVFKDDFVNKNLPAKSAMNGPRQPWHDLHCKIEGPAAYDVLLNFEERWKRAGEWRYGKRFKPKSPWQDDALIDMDNISWITHPPGQVDHPNKSLHVNDDTDNWHVQIFRSIDSGSAEGFPKDSFAAERRSLDFEKHTTIDRSIQIAYIQAIRSAQHFIYIENQYFIGSSYAWGGDGKSAGANNCIPMELAQKIISKIRAKERFVVYVVIPMWPEGDPKSATVQQIIYLQRMTMQMMYRLIAKELSSAKKQNSVPANARPTDYLNFYCLGNREEPSLNEETFKNDKSSPVEKNGVKRWTLGCFRADDQVSSSQKFRRFMIYVHSKGMIVDDEYVILGSANINQRSMAGSRDTEIAMGAYQPHYTWQKKNKHPHGQVYGYRMSLWAEHLGSIDDSFKDPKELDCVNKVNSVAEDNWRKYTDVEFKKLEGHILKYPIEVNDEDGDVTHMQNHEYFPDVGGKILGTLNNLTYLLTT